MRNLPAWLPDLARSERLRIALAWGLEPLEGHTRVETFRYPVRELLRALEQPGWPEAKESPTQVEFLKVPGLPAVLPRQSPRPPGEGQGKGSTGP